MPGRVATVAVGLLVALTSIGCGPPVELPAEAPPSTTAPTVTTATAPTTTVPTTTTTAAVVPRVHPAVSSPAVPARIASTPRSGADPGDPAVWDALAGCESGGNWASRTGAYRGGLQFLPSTWQSVGGVGDPADASREEQIRRGQILQARSGWSQWPACSRRLGYR